MSAKARSQTGKFLCCWWNADNKTKDGLQGATSALTVVEAAGENEAAVLVANQYPRMFGKMRVGVVALTEVDPNVIP